MTRAAGAKARARRVIARVFRVAACVGVLAACGTSNGAASNDDASTQRITVLGAASLVEVIDDAIVAYAAQHPDVEVTAVSAGSQTLVQQLAEGAPADLLITADPDTMQRAIDSGLIGGSAHTVATNDLVIAVPRGNPADISALRDLTRPDVVVALAAPDVPAGRYATALFAAADLVVVAATEEPNVRAVATKVALGEVDAGIVYRTDVLANASDVELIETGVDGAPTATYPAGVVADGNTAPAEEFLEFLLSEDGQAIFAARGFGTAPG